MANAISAVGALFRVREGENTGSFLGTCFAFQTTAWVLSAAHCVGDLDADTIAAVWPPANTIRRAVQVEKHETSDIALLRFPEMLDAAVDPFKAIASYDKLGEDFYAVGFTEGFTGDAPKSPTARLYKGHFQRFFDHTSFFGYHYSAGELSIAAPGGEARTSR